MTTAETSTAAARFLADAKRPSVRLDSYNRYVLPDPMTGKERAWTRATTWAGAVKETWALSRWSRRMAAHGLAMRPDLIASIAVDVSTFGAGQFDDRDCKPLDEAIVQAQGHAGATSAATLGTVMHRYTEQLDSTGEFPEVVPPPLDRDLAAYATTMERHHFTPVAVERIVCVPELGVAGTLDRVLSRGDAYIGDLKTGAKITYGWGEIAVQLALYAHASFMWDEDRWEPMRPVDQQRAVVMHVPIGSGRCDLYWVDIAAGWETANRLCGPVREWRTRRDLATKIDGEDSWAPSPPAAGATTGASPDATARSGASAARPGNERTEWLSARLQALAPSERGRFLVGQRWPEGVTIKPPWTSEDIDRLASVLEGIERDIEAPFGPNDPTHELPEAPRIAVEPIERVPAWDVADDGVQAPDDDVATLTTYLSFFNDAQRATLLRWNQEAKREQRAFDLPMTRRTWACARAAMGCAAHLGDDDRTSRALTYVVGGWGEHWTVGVVLGSLNLPQAEALADLADGYAAGDEQARMIIDPI